MPSATPRRQSSHRRRRSTNTPNQPNPPRTQPRRGGNAGYPQHPDNTGKTTATGKAGGRSVAGSAPTNTTHGGNAKNAAPLPPLPLPPLEIERTADTSSAPPHHAVGEMRSTMRPMAEHPGVDRTHTPPPAPSTRPEGAFIPPLPTAAPLPRAPLSPSKTPPAPPVPSRVPTSTPSPIQHAQQTKAVDTSAEQRRHPHSKRRRHHTANVRAALGYAIPFAPALWHLARERRARFVRLHAAQSLVFFGMLALGQIALFVALVSLGQAITDLTASVTLGVVFLLLFGVLGIGGFSLWLLLLTDAMSGRLRPYPYLSRLATLVERGATRLQLWFERGGGFRSRATR